MKIVISILLKSYTRFDDELNLYSSSRRMKYLLVDSKLNPIAYVRDVVSGLYKDNCGCWVRNGKCLPVTKQ